MQLGAQISGIAQISETPQLSLPAYAEEVAPELQALAQRRDADGEMTTRALDIVREFIIERRLLVFGGQAIDYALRLKGSRLYPEDKLPDLDVLSPRSVDDAYDLAERLHRKGFKHVAAVRAIHVQTMRVRTDHVYVADIGYAPPDVIARLHTVEYQGMRVIHPDIQRIDMHLSFCYPFDNSPREDVYHRWKKDLARLNMFERHYPIKAPAPPSAPPSAPAEAARVTTVRSSVPLAGAPEGLTAALHGFAAYAMLRAEIGRLSEVKLQAPHLTLKFLDTHSFSAALPAGECAHVVSPAPEGIIGSRDAIWRDPYMDMCPATARVGDLEVLATRGRMAAASTMAIALDGVTHHVRVVTPQHVLLFMLYSALRSDSLAEKNIYYRYYGYTLEILRAAEQVYKDPGLLARSPFGLVVTPLGTRNESPSYCLKIQGFAATAKIPPPPLPFTSAQMSGLPMGYRPDRARMRPSFDYDACFMFRRSGGVSV